MPSPLFCDHCHSLYPADGLDHFALLGLTPRYDLDPAELRQRYLQVSRGVHPDYHGTGTQSATSLQVSAQLNEAYRVLSDPVLRAEYLLELTGGPPATADKTVEREVLCVAFALREEIAEAKAANHSAALEACRTRVQRMYDETLARIGQLARQLPGDADLRQRLRAALNSIKYTRKLQSEL